MSDTSEITQIAESFFIKEDAKLEIEPLISGHINSTYKVQIGNQEFLFQKVNSSVFSDLNRINQNISILGKHLNSTKYPFEILELISFNEDQFLFNKNWRVFRYIPNTQTLLKVKSAAQAESAARALSSFYAHSLSLDPKNIQDSIEGFIDFKQRLNSFQKALQTADSEKLEKAQTLIDFLVENQSLISQWELVKKLVPQRIIHGDPKISNFLFDANDEKQVISLIDWDTLMKGPVLYDFGDMALSFTNRNREDDLSEENSFCFQTYQSLKTGFLSDLKSELTENEVSNLDLGAKVVTYVQALRFLTDYLQGNTYFTVQYPTQNLDRARSQTRLLKAMIKQLH